MNDIRPPRRPTQSLVPPPRPLGVGSTPTPAPRPPTSLIDQGKLEPMLEAHELPRLAAATEVVIKKKNWKKRIAWIFGVLVLLIALAAGGAIWWYTTSLQPVSPGDKTRVRVQVIEGSSPADIGALLQEKHLIKNTLAFDIYTRLSSTRSSLRAGTYSLSPSESTEAIVTHLVAGKVDQFNITFLPGATLAENRHALIKAGYGEDEVDAALSKTYDLPLFKDKPAGSDLEGYIYGETYTFATDTSVEQILLKTFDEFDAVLQSNNLVEKFKKQGLNLYQGITLASIIQREVPNPVDQKQVAQIFLKRKGMGMPLGSDVTYQYAAKKMDVTPSPDLESPYNTRKYPGLPPGPIAVPGLTALQAVGDPASGDYLYFLSGDDDTTYYARTDAEHEANIQNHCQVKCLLP